MKNLTFIISKSDNYFTASCIDENIITQGKNFNLLLNNIKEAVELHFEDVKSKKFISPFTLVYSDVFEYVK